MIKLNKTRARKAFNKGQKITFALSKTHPQSIFATWFQKGERVNDFDKTVKSFEHYNGCYELGYYTHFYTAEA